MLPTSIIPQFVGFVVAELSLIAKSHIFEHFAMLAISNHDPVPILAALCYVHPLQRLFGLIAKFLGSSSVFCVTSILEVAVRTAKGVLGGQGSSVPRRHGVSVC